LIAKQQRGHAHLLNDTTVCRTMTHHFEGGPRMKPAVLAMPKPNMVFADTPYGTAYAWKIADHGLCVLGDTRKQCVEAFLEAHRSEYGTEFHGVETFGLPGISPG